MSKIVLVVEDMPDIRTMMKFLLQNFGYQVIEAADGVEAVESVKKKSSRFDFDGFVFAEYGRFDRYADNQKVRRLRQNSHHRRNCLRKLLLSPRD